MWPEGSVHGDETSIRKRQFGRGVLLHQLFDILFVRPRVGIYHALNLNHEWSSAKAHPVLPVKAGQENNLHHAHDERHQRKPDHTVAIKSPDRIRFNGSRVSLGGIVASSPTERCILFVPRERNRGRHRRESRSSLCFRWGSMLRSRKDTGRPPGEETIRLSHRGSRDWHWERILQTGIDFRASCRPWSIASIERQDGISSCFSNLSEASRIKAGKIEFLYSVDGSAFGSVLSTTAYSNGNPVGSSILALLPFLGR